MQQRHDHVGAESLATVLAGTRVIVMYVLAAVQQELLRVAEIARSSDCLLVGHFVMYMCAIHGCLSHMLLTRCFVFVAFITNMMIIVFQRHHACMFLLLTRAGRVSLAVQSKTCGHVCMLVINLNDVSVKANAKSLQACML